MSHDAIISESSFVGSENLPDDMARSLDKPWHFVGESDPCNPPPYLRCFCVKCNRRPVLRWDSDEPIERPYFYTVDLTGRTFITDDRLSVVVYFGVCDNCGQAHWGRSGPPFMRVHSYQGVLT